MGPYLTSDNHGDAFLLLVSKLVHPARLLAIEAIPGHYSSPFLVGA